MWTPCAWEPSRMPTGRPCAGCWRIQRTFLSTCCTSTGAEASRYTTFVARHGEQLDGMLGGTFDADLAATGVFDAFELPPAPHAFLDRIHVREPVRGQGVGRALVEAYAIEALERECTFVGGSIELSSEPTARRAFFDRLGFTIREHDNFGACPADVLAAIWNG